MVLNAQVGVGYLFWRTGERIADHQDDRVSSQKHLRHVSVLVDRLGLLLAFVGFRDLGPHLFHIFQHHVEVSEQK